MDSADIIVSKLVEKARIAQKQFELYSQDKIDQATLAVGWALINPKNNERLAQLAVETTGLGKVEDKITKNHRKTLGLLSDLKDKATIGVIDDNLELGLVKIARPVGVVGAIVPSTNPLATPVNNIINALKCGNAIIISPSPKGYQSWIELKKLIDKEFVQLDIPLDLVQALPQPVNKENSLALMKQVDLIVCTGSQNNVRSVYSSGNFAIGVGLGNAPVIVDETADLKDAAVKITQSKTFDHATSCSSENSLILPQAIYDQFLNELKAQKAVLLDATEKARLQEVMWQDGKLNQNIIAQSFNTIAHECGFDYRDRSFFLVEEDTIGKNAPFSGEKLALVTAVYKTADFSTAIEQADQILRYQGQGHSVGLHTSQTSRGRELGLKLPVCRVIVNQPHSFAVGGNFNNSMPFSLSMGCGSWGKNSIDENLNYTHFMNTTKVVYPIDEKKVSLDDIFSQYPNY